MSAVHERSGVGALICGGNVSSKTKAKYSKTTNIFLSSASLLSKTSYSAVEMLMTIAHKTLPNCQITNVHIVFIYFYQTFSYFIV